MADEEDRVKKRQEWHKLLIGLKTTVEGLLATHTANVWNTYGGLSRVHANMENILNHGLNVVVGTMGSVLDYWEFVKGLRWMNPVLAPSMDQLKKRVSGEEGLSLGQIWLRRSLLNHTLSTQLTLLVSDKEHLTYHYSVEAFLCQREYMQALLICLQAIEQNQAALLAEISPALFSFQQRPRVFHVRSVSLPINQLNGGQEEPETNEMRLNRDPLAPLFASPKSESILTTSDEHARPCIMGLESSERRSSAKEALLQVLEKSGDTVDPGNIVLNTDSTIMTDPLMNMQVFIPSDYLTRTGRFPPGLHSIEDSDRAKPNRNKLHSRRSSDALDSILNKSVDRRFSHKRVSRVKSSSDLCDGDSEFYPHRIADKCESLSTVQDCDVEEDADVITRSHDSGVSTLGLVSTCVKDQGTQTKEPTAKMVKKSHVRSVSDFGVPSAHRQSRNAGNLIQFADETDTTAAVEHSNLSSSLPSVSRLHSSESQGSFPQPTEGQSLRSFLSSQDFHTCAQVDKENAHFNICETLIAAIEQMKWNQAVRPQEESDQEECDSDEEIQSLKQRIRIRRRERLKEKSSFFPMLSNGKADTASLSLSSTPESLNVVSDSNSSSDEIQDRDLETLDASSKEAGEASNLTSLQENGLSLSMASLYSDADIARNMNAERQNSIAESGSSLLSAESVAISLIKRFSERQLPKASDLEWLVSEQDAPQALLPLPNSYPVSPDEGENADIANANKRVRMRGNLEWAPPRAQIIFTIHPPPKRKVLIAKQNYLCAGCGTKVEPGFMKRFRYCEYTGKYFCLRCHTNATEYIPGRILRKGDFTKYHVSNFAHDLLNKIYDAPLFNVADINPALYRRLRALDQIRECRLQLYHLHSFLKTCRNGQSMLAELERHPLHWHSDIHMYSLAELVTVKKGELVMEMRSLVNDSVTHVSQCQLCQAKGFICELCNNPDDIIFPFELSRVTQCEECRSCFHKNCPLPDKCPKCTRIEIRRSQQAEMRVSDFEAEDGT